MIVKVYTAGYMAGAGSDRFDWRRELVIRCAENQNIQFLHPGVPEGAIPGQGDPAVYADRDVLCLRSCDIVFAYMDLQVARCIGASWEMGYAHALGKPIIMVDHSPGIGSLDLNRARATVWGSLDEAISHLQFVCELGIRYEWRQA